MRDGHLGKMQLNNPKMMVMMEGMLWALVGGIGVKFTIAIVWVTVDTL